MSSVRAPEGLRPTGVSFVTMCLEKAAMLDYANADLNNLREALLDLSTITSLPWLTLSYSWRITFLPSGISCRC